MFQKKLWDIFQIVKKTNPLVQNITNFVVMEYVANVLLAAGASPIMSNIHHEFEDLTKALAAVSINIGMLDEVWIANINKNVKLANERSIPIVLDPVASGATNFRTNFSKELLEKYKIDVIRGNASEIGSLISQDMSGKGVDSTISSDEVIDIAIEISKKYSAIICVSGENDYIINGLEIYKISNGHALMQKVTGMGCALGALIAAFLGASNDYLFASLSAISLYGVVGELASKNTEGPGSFKMKFIDKLYNISQEEFLSTLKISHVT